MHGAREFATMFSTGQHGRLFFEVGSHARGKTFRIFVLPEGVAVPKDAPHMARGVDSVEVYGVTGGQPGWTESYGWLHKGKWQDDFAKMVATRQAEIAAEAEARATTQKDREAEAVAKHASLLAAY